MLKKHLKIKSIVFVNAIILLVILVMPQMSLSSAIPSINYTIATTSPQSLYGDSLLFTSDNNSDTITLQLNSPENIKLTGTYTVVAHTPALSNAPGYITWNAEINGSSQTITQNCTISTNTNNDNSTNNDKDTLTLITAAAATTFDLGGGYSLLLTINQNTSTINAIPNNSPKEAKTTATFEVVRTVPVPAAGWLLGTGIVGLFVVRRKFRPFISGSLKRIVG